MTELCKIAKKYGTDKYPFYTPYYFELLKDKRDTFRKILELGVGCPKRMAHVPNYQSGASLKMWRDFFPNALIFGADNTPDAIIKDERIETFLIDERNENDLKKLINKTGTDIDLFIDDAIHVPSYQLFVFRKLMPLFKKNVIYIIEDAKRFSSITTHLGSYNFHVLDATGKAVIIRNKI